MPVTVTKAGGEPHGVHIPLDPLAPIRAAYDKARRAVAGAQATIDAIDARVPAITVVVDQVRADAGAIVTTVERALAPCTALIAAVSGSTVVGSTVVDAFPATVRDVETAARAGARVVADLRAVLHLSASAGERVLADAAARRAEYVARLHRAQATLVGVRAQRDQIYAALGAKVPRDEDLDDVTRAAPVPSAVPTTPAADVPRTLYSMDESSVARVVASTTDVEVLRRWLDHERTVHAAGHRSAERNIALLVARLADVASTTKEAAE